MGFGPQNIVIAGDILARFTQKGLSIDMYSLGKVFSFILQTNRFLMNGLDSTNSDLLINIWRHNEMDVSFEDYAESWISMNKVPLHNQTVDFMRILALLCHDSVEHRIMMDDGILNVLDNLVNEPRTAVDWSRVEVLIINLDFGYLPTVRSQIKCTKKQVWCSNVKTSC